jgi:hypothetical protein
MRRYEENRKQQLEREREKLEELRKLTDKRSKEEEAMLEEQRQRLENLRLKQKEDEEARRVTAMEKLKADAKQQQLDTKKFLENEKRRAYREAEEKRKANLEIKQQQEEIKQKQRQVCFCGFLWFCVKTYTHLFPASLTTATARRD